MLSILPWVGLDMLGGVCQKSPCDCPGVAKLQVLAFPTGYSYQGMLGDVVLQELEGRILGIPALKYKLLFLCFKLCWHKSTVMKDTNVNDDTLQRLVM